MHYVTVQAPIQIKQSNGKPMQEFGDDKKAVDMKPTSFHRFIMDFLVNDVKENKEPKIGVGYQGIKRTRKLDEKFEHAAVGEVVGVEDADWEAVKTIIEEKIWSPVVVGAQLCPFMDAWVTAPEQKPHVNGKADPEYKQHLADA